MDRENQRDERRSGKWTGRIREMNERSEKWTGRIREMNGEVENGQGESER